MRAALDLRDSAFNLGAARIIIFATLLYSVERWAPCVRAVAAWPSDAWMPPEGMRILVRLLPPSPALADAGLWALRIAALCGLFGLWPRAAAGACALLSVHVFGTMWCHGGMHHMLHHFPLMLAILAVSRCGDALAVRPPRDEALAARPALDYGLPLRAMGVTLGLIYFFPGAWKALSAPDWWFTGDAVQIVSWRDWGFGGPRFTLDSAPALRSAIGAFTVVFEVVFLPLVLWRPARPLLAGAGIVFHTGITAMTGIDFFALSICLLVLIDWQALLQRRARRPEWSAPGALGRFLPLASVCAALWTSMTVAGVRDRHMAWPIAAYPTFRGVWPARQATVEAVAVGRDGVERALDDGAMRSACGHVWWKVKQNLALADDSDPAVVAWRRGVLGLWARGDGVDPVAATLRLYAAVRSTRPEDAGASPLSRRLLVELPSADRER